MTGTIRRIAVIGGGPVGFGIARALLAENAFDTVTIFEQRDRPGGVWNYMSDKRKHLSDDPTMVSAMYADLVTNLPSSLMEFRDTPFAPSAGMYPPRDTVLDYVLRYSQQIKGADVVYGTKVNNVRKDKGQWEVGVQSMRDGKDKKTYTFDAVVVSTGHYDFPYVPDVTGLAEWAAADPLSIRHAKLYDSETEFKNKKVLVIGSASSGLDILTQLLRVTAPVYISSTKPSWVGEDQDVVNVGRIVRYDYASRSAEDGDGNRVTGIDAVLFCTGYLYAFPFLDGGMPPLSSIEPTATEDNMDDDRPITDGHRVRRLYKHIFYSPDPTLAFGALPKMVVPFPLAESQGAVIARVWSGRLSLPREHDMRADEASRIRESGPGRSYHSFPTPSDVEYYRMLAQWCASARDPDLGFHPDPWPDSKKDLRGRSGELKKQMLKDNIEKARQIRQG